MNVDLVTLDHMVVITTVISVVISVVITIENGPPELWYMMNILENNISCGSYDYEDQGV